MTINEIIAPLSAVFVILLILTYLPLPTLWKVAVVMLMFLAVVIGMAVTARPDRGKS